MVSYVYDFDYIFSSLKLFIFSMIKSLLWLMYFFPLLNFSQLQGYLNGQIFANIFVIIYLWLFNTPAFICLFLCIEGT